MNNITIILGIVIIGAIVLLSTVSLKEKYHNHEYTYSPYMEPSCRHTYENNPIPNGYVGMKCLLNSDCHRGLKCCYEKPGFELLPTSGKCRHPSHCGPNTTLQEWRPRQHR